jgi:hypothetical protein
VAAVAVAAAVTAWLALASDGSLRSWTLVLALPAVPVLAGGLLLRLPVAIPAAVTLLGATYTIRLLADVEELDDAAPVVAAALYALCELSYWSLEARGRIREEAGVQLRRLGLLAAFAVGTIVLGVTLLAVVDTLESGGTAVEVLGASAAVAALGLLALASRRKDA